MYIVLFGDERRHLVAVVRLAVVERPRELQLRGVRRA